MSYPSGSRSSVRPGRNLELTDMASAFEATRGAFASPRYLATIGN